MRDRDLLIEDLFDIETVLLALEGIGPELSARAVIKTITRSVYHILVHAIRVIDRQGREKKQPCAKRFLDSWRRRVKRLFSWR